MSLPLRWAPLIAGIAWIGSSFHFIWLDLGLKKRADLLRMDWYVMGVEGRVPK